MLLFKKTKTQSRWLQHIIWNVERVLHFMELEILDSSLRSDPNKLCDFGKDSILYGGLIDLQSNSDT